jgi:hypothetical protein
METREIQCAADGNGTTDPGSHAIEAMAKHGITCVPVDNFRYGGYRYTNLQDAIAEAKRHPRQS